MNYKETLFFVAKCLTITLEDKNRIEIENLLKNTEIDWDSVVKVSTQHFVFPALYCNLKRVNLLQYLPEELVNYMIHITDLNRERNKQIIEQAKEINSLLLANEITPIFLKGTGNLLEGLYGDIAERMVGDIDIILKKEDVIKANNILREINYNSSAIMFDDHRHLARLIKEKKIAAIELHKDFLEIPYRKNFNYFTVKDSIIQSNDITCFLGDIDKMAMNIFSNQITDNYYEKAQIILRNFYDFFLLSKKCTHNEVILKYPINQKIINSYWSLNSFLIDRTKHNKINTIEKSDTHIKRFLWKLNNPKTAIYLDKILTMRSYLKTRSLIFVKAFYKKSNYKFVISRLTSKEWFNRRIFNSKSNS